MIPVGKLAPRIVGALQRVGTVAKAVAAAVGGLATVTATVLADGEIGLDEIGPLTAGLAAAVGTVYAVWRVPNRDEKGK